MPSSSSSASSSSSSAPIPAPPGVVITPYRDETQLALIQPLIDNDLSEPYSIFTYRYFITQWPHLCHLALDLHTSICLGVIVCKLDLSSSPSNSHSLHTGYIAMLAVHPAHRNHGLGSALVSASIRAMRSRHCHQVVLEAEVSNLPALALYDRLGFIRHKRLEKYYLNGNDAFRLKLRLQPF